MGPPAQRESLVPRSVAHERDGTRQRTDPPARGAGEIWLQGDALLCACPECGAPMSVRLWLMMADCWRCGTSIELTEEQEREAQRLLAHRSAPAGPRAAPSPTVREPVHHGISHPAGPAARVTPSDAPVGQPRDAGPPAPHETRGPRSLPGHAPPLERPSERRPGPAPDAPAPRPPPRRPAAVPPPLATRRPTNQLRELIRATPAWLISLILHLMLLLLLAVLTFQSEEEEDPYITLTTAVSRHPQDAGEGTEIDVASRWQFDLPVPAEVDLNDEAQRQAVVRADQDARELRVDPETIEPNLPDLARVRKQLASAHTSTATFAARDPRLRVEIVKREGGTTLTEAAVARGLRWLDAHQNRDGSWSLHKFDREPGCTCGGRGMTSDSAGTALALLPFLGAGQTHLVGRYQDTVSKGLRWLIERQKEDGDLRAGSLHNAGMYAHGQATIVLCEAFAMSGDERLRLPAQKGIDFIVAAQHPGGGWRYTPRQAGDTSVFGWQVMALQSARAAGLDIPQDTFELAEHYLDDVAHERGARYAYQPRQGPTPVMTAEALLCRVYLGWTADRPPLLQGTRSLVDESPPSAREPNVYYWYYGTQLMHHLGGENWKRWNQRLREILVESQEKKGHQAGSWDPRGPHAEAGGRIYMTALAVCTLEVYYRHLPIFRRIDVESARGPAP